MDDFDFDFDDDDDDDDLRAVGAKVLEMAERAKVMDLVSPGARARSRFEVDGVSYLLTPTVERKESGATA